MTLQTQFVTMGMMLLGGLSLGGLFDLYRVLASQLKAPRYAYYLLDLVFWLIGTLLVFKLLYASNLGQVRMFIFVGLLLGIAVYFMLFSRAVVQMILWMIRFVRALIRIGKRTIEILIIKPIVWMYRATIIILGFLLAIAIFLYKIMLQLLYPVWKLLWWLSKPLIRRIHIPSWINKSGQVVSSFIRRLFGRT
ncbi:spore cortex biosynthesis protein YabQ [Paenibacillus radicis (ex Xue et al. 2023)]|uniref:Spore cortex biosynthesis protein YabQ n=1 Tax=Paenibacillus radicis (ex Xue et al. 2023) TaxID=2972489 RepID=A0ABT1YSF3_9BACL|nr:spore cortex biosynthesis protein YabQ [Paenibacillus radicis (ex Xue et al. 2023)]MCR8636116.1 spore cortex biosynthesis protein YabQ [Paenibacillus radicis (ex Xue et al. 2023)]